MASFAGETKDAAAADTMQDTEEPVPTSRDVPTLLAEHRESIDALKALVQDALPAADKDGVVSDGIWLKYDDIFFLRYILSFGTAAAGEEPVRKTIAYRSQEGNRELFTKVKTTVLSNGVGGWVDEPLVKTMEKYQVADDLPKAQKHGGFTVVIRGGMGNSSAVFEALTRDEMLKANFAYREISFMRCDIVTRETGYLAKQVLLFDMKGSRLSDMMDRRQSGIHKEVSSSSAYLYPQLVDKMCMVNAPSWMSYVLGFFRKILPKRNMDKIALFTNQNKFWSSEWAQSTFARDEVPEFVGGTLPDDKLSEKLKGTLLEGEGEEVMTTVVVPARSTRDVVLDVPLKGATIVVTINLAGYGVEVSATHAHGGEGGECTVPTGKSTVLREGGKVKAENGTQKLELFCAEPGVATIKLDNAYSMLRSKTIRYRLEITVAEPAEPAEPKAAAGGGGDE